VIAEIVFVCAHGNVKSLIASQWFNRLAAGHGLSARAVSRGLTPENPVPPAIVDRLRGDGFDVSAYQARALTPADVEGASRVVLIGVEAPEWLLRSGAAIEAWDDIPPASERYDASRDAMRARIESLLRELKRGSIPGLVRYFLGLGTTGFGGPIALVGFMQRDLVERRRWFSAEEYREGLALAQLAPGPLAAQLAMYLGWARGGASAAALVGLAFVLPSFAMVLALSVGYLRYGGLDWMQGAFYGVGAAVIAIIARSAVKLTRLTLGRDLLLWMLFAFAGLVTAWTESEVLWVFLGCGALAMVIRARPLWRPQGALGLALLPPAFLCGLAGPASADVLWRIAWYFAEAGSFVFGSGLAIVPFLHGGVVKEFGWLSERQFLDAVAVAMITPGPVVITVAFIGYLVAGPVGAVVAALGTFLPCYVFTVLPAPHYKRWSQARGVREFVAGVTAAATGAIAGAAFVLGRRAVVDLPTSAIALATLAIAWRFRQIPEPLLILAAGVAGVALKGMD
jgi:chromate transporter